MRITNQMMSQNLLRNLETAQGKIDNLQNQLSSNLRISKPSDDPVGIQNAMRLKSNISSVEQWKNNADEAIGYMNTTDSTLGEMSSMLQRARELAVQGANGSYTTADKNIMADEVDQIYGQLEIMATTQIGSKYIFSGTATDQKLQIDPVDGTVSQGNTQDVDYDLGNKISISINGQTLFGGPGTTPLGVFSTLINLSAALRVDDSTGIDTALTDISENIDNVVAQRANLGARTNRVTAIWEQLDSTSANLQKNLSGILDADIAKTITDFKNQENTYKAALSVGAQIIQPSLVDFIR